MKYATVVLASCLIIVLFLLIQTIRSNAELRAAHQKSGRDLADLQASVKRQEAALVQLQETLPDIGEYMTTFQLHIGKLWFAVKASNWELADYEVNELNESMEAAEALHSVKNDVNISGVLNAVRQTEVAGMADSIKNKNALEFQKNYDETLSACNGCHESAGFKFIRIVRPTAPPVTNQLWELGK